MSSSAIPTRATSIPEAVMFDRFLAGDSAYDGRFLTGVLSTRIYCLPSCTARKPLRRNVVFFSSEPEARQAGLRACKRCRPDHFYRRYDPDLELVTTLVARLDHQPGSIGSVRALVEMSGIGSSRLHELFRRHYHATPAEIIRRARVSQAARELLETKHPLLDVALNAGFESSSVFHDAFRRVMAMAPGAFRRLRDGDQFTITLPRGYRLSHTLRVHGRDSESLCERVEGNRLTKAMIVDGSPVTLEITFSTAEARVRMLSSSPISSAGVSAHRAVLRMLGLSGSSPAAFERRVGSDPDLAMLVSGRRGLHIPQSPDVFEGLAWSIIGQQVNLPFAFKMRRAVVELRGQNAEGGLRAHPSASEVASLDYSDLTGRQFSRMKAEYLIDSARLVASGELPLENLPYGSATRARELLLSVRGIGAWSANYVMMRGCGFADCVPLGDTGLTSGLQRFFALEERPDGARTTELMERFAPFRSLATFHLWMQKGDPA
ncbi:MAG: Ada metal-binding domain-containing protein [Acidobacteriota bacterium]